MSGKIHLERDGAVAVLIIDNPPVNAGSAAVRSALLARIAEVEADPDLRAGVLIGAGKSFIAGSDLREFDLPLAEPQLPQVIAALEGSAKPWVAALHGAALGGGYELALAADARIASPDTVLGLPECGLGIIPGAGGTQKLPRLVGRARAISLICAGTRVGGAKALDLGMIDALATGDLRAQAVALALATGKRRVIERDLPEETASDIEAAAKKAATKGKRRPHILEAIAQISAVGQLPAAAGLAAERAAFEHLRVQPEARALRHIFFAERQSSRGVAPAGTPGPTRSFGVLGAGTMGASIALAALQAGFPVVLVDSDPAALDRASTRIRNELGRGVAAGRLTLKAAEAAQAALILTDEMARLGETDVLIEAVVEDLDVKRQVFARLDAVAKPGALIATNTSYLDIDPIAAATSRPETVIGLHFFSPAHVMKLLEVVPGGATSAEAVATGLAVARALGKQPVQAGNAFGFIGNRIYAAYRAASEFLLEEGALPQEVDAALEDFGFAMGPCAVADLSGLDIAWRMRRQQAPQRDPKARYVEIPDLLCAVGRLGCKTGAGYYRYDQPGKRQPDPAVETIIAEARARKGIRPRLIGPDEIRNRVLATLINEAGLVLEEGVAAHPGDVDVVLVNGYGFPRWTGGPLYWAKQQDPVRLTADCAQAVAAFGAQKRAADLAGLGLLATSRKV